MSKRKGEAAKAPLEMSRGFPPVTGRGDVVLVLGSLPSEASIAAGQYYAHPRNAFWTIMGELCGAGPALGYAARLAALRRCGIALWDVLAAAGRPGSLDASIVAASAEVNDFAALFAQQPRIEIVCFNGRKAAELFERRVVPDLAARFADLPRIVLPSTSPANASLGFDAKLARWRDALGERIGRVRPGRGPER